MSDARRLTPLRLMLIAACWVGYFALMTVIYTSHPDGADDYIAYDQAARFLNTGQPLYTGIDGYKPYLYPPLLAILWAPVVAVADFHESSLIWLALNMAVLAVTLAVVARQLRTRRLRLILWAAPLLYAPVLMSFWHGQATVLMFALVVGAWDSYKRNRHALAGVMLAVGAYIKIFPVVLIAYFVLRRDWQVVKASVASGVVLGMVQWLLVGTDNITAFLVTILPDLAVNGQPAVYVAHSGITGFAARLFTPVAYTIPIMYSDSLFTVTRLVLMGIVVSVPVWLAASNQHVRERDNTVFDLEYVLVLTSTLLVMSSVSVAGLIPLLLVYAVLLSEVGSSSVVRVACIAAFALGPIQIILQTGYLGSDQARLPALALSTPFFSTVILWVVNVYVLASRRGIISAAGGEQAAPTAKTTT